ncbi:MAG: cob(I)yrinic acid a,c-diamide adenosyltransferase [Candidatus Marsarchaeota archaeon]|jgi:cob(I)alamin adenosyltransferase|nr:cob(I)yrinic acid a,c-diamide adenosyltransferase [Candidatus Marsarchaeota archaeon]MCL5419220.1 cob(I)yrinic acid a,c-diamide adenosyltransferase [Candidatus Marsarchaeota archaeon]
MSKFYTGLGDTGYTNLIKAGKIKKSSKIIEAIGNIDELNSAIGVAITNLTTDRISKTLKDIQNILFIIGAELATPSSESAVKRKIGEHDVKALEEHIEELGSAVSIDRFVLPGGSIGASYLHLARSICRRAERSVIALGNIEEHRHMISYMNRLSSYLFVAALYVNKLEGVDESSPTY